MPITPDKPNAGIVPDIMAAGWIGACATALGRLTATLRKAATPRSAPVATAKPHVPPCTESAAAAAPLARLSNVVESAARHAERAEQCHRGAEIRVDAALYELEQLRADLSGVVSLGRLDAAPAPAVERPTASPAATSSRRRPASVPPARAAKAARARSARSAA